MIHFFKPKPYLHDFIPEEYVDIHSHLLPGIDDGAPDIETTIKLINGMQSLGFTKFITTPHIMGEVWDNTGTSILTKEKETKNIQRKNRDTHAVSTLVNFETAYTTST